MKQKFQPILFATVALIALCSPLVVATPVFAADCAVLPADWCHSGGSGDGIKNLLTLVINILTAGIGIVGVAVFVYAGIMYSSAGDKADQVSKAKNIMTQAVIGLILFAVMYLGIQWLIPGGII